MVKCLVARSHCGPPLVIRWASIPFFGLADDALRCLVVLLGIFLPVIMCID
jgi:hypothetical protein